MAVGITHQLPEVPPHAYKVESSCMTKVGFTFFCSFCSLCPHKRRVVDCYYDGSRAVGRLAVWWRAASLSFSLLLLWITKVVVVSAAPAAALVAVFFVVVVGPEGAFSATAASTAKH